MAIRTKESFDMSRLATARKSLSHLKYISRLATLQMFCKVIFNGRDNRKVGVKKLFTSAEKSCERKREEKAFGRCCVRNIILGEKVNQQPPFRVSNQRTEPSHPRRSLAQSKIPCAGRHIDFSVCLRFLCSPSLPEQCNFLQQYATSSSVIS